MPENLNPLLQLAHSSRFSYFVTNWTCSPPFSDNLRYALICGNLILWVLSYELPNVLSASFLSYKGFDSENSLLIHIPHCKNNELRTKYKAHISHDTVFISVLYLTARRVIFRSGRWVGIVEKIQCVLCLRCCYFPLLDACVGGTR
jgi:hypothetical protein